MIHTHVILFFHILIHHLAWPFDTHNEGGRGKNAEAPEHKTLAYYLNILLFEQVFQKATMHGVCEANL